MTMKDIIIVEDGVQERQRLESLFSNAGYSLTACASVGEAEQAVIADQYRLAILDIGLGDRSGSYLFGVLARNRRVAHILIFTGNPSVHLKQRFLDEGAVDYIVKASPQARDEQFLARVRELIGEAVSETSDSISLETFLSSYIPASSRPLFLTMEDKFPSCGNCGASDYTVTFSHMAQMPPELHGLVVCRNCGRPMDPEIE